MKLLKPMIDRHAAYRVGVGLAVMGALLVLMAAISSWIVPPRAAGRGRSFPVAVGVSLVGLGIAAMIAATRVSSASRSRSPQNWVKSLRRSQPISSRPVDRERLPRVENEMIGHDASTEAPPTDETELGHEPTGAADVLEAKPDFESAAAGASDADGVKDEWAVQALEADEQVCSWCHAANNSEAKHCEECGMRI